MYTRLVRLNSRLAAERGSIARGFGTIAAVFLIATVFLIAYGVYTNVIHL